MIGRTNRRWVRGMFGLSPSNKDSRNLSLRQPTSGDYKFADTTLGGNAVINPPPQFTRFADIRSTGLFATNNHEDGGRWLQNENNAGSYQLGRVYNELFEENNQQIHMRFGVAKYTGSIAFFANMFDRNAYRLAKHGEFTLMFRGGQMTGLVAMFYIVPWAILLPLMITSQTLKFVLNKKPSKYYYLKPTMHLYLQAVQAMIDTQLVHWKLVPLTDVFGSNAYLDATRDDNKLKESMEQIYQALPDIWKANGKFDVFKLMNRYQVLANYQNTKMEEIYENASKQGISVNQALKEYVARSKASGVAQQGYADQADGASLEVLSQAYSNNVLYQQDELSDEAEAKYWEKSQSKLSSIDGVSADAVLSEQELGTKPGPVDADGNPVNGDAEAQTVDPNQDGNSFWAGLADFFGNVTEGLSSEVKDGAQWVSFRVDPKETVTDSVTNSTKTPEIASAVNGLSSKARTINFSTSGGNTGFDAVDAVTTGVKDFVSGALDSLQLSGLLAVAGGSIVDFPEVWDDSQANVGSQSYTIQLRSPYGNDFSLFQNLIIPLCFLLAGALPLSTGKQSFVSPFLCEIFSRGKQTTRLGIIDSMTITRGVGNYGWRADGKPMAIDVTFNVKDLTTVLSMPLLKDRGIFDDDNKYTDYMATLGAASLQDLSYALRKITLNFNVWKQSWKSRFMAGRISNDIGSWALTRAFANITAGTSISR